MGIRFRCPNGHKLHVKAFLAGKRGICPHCSARFVIPPESDPQLVKDSKHDDAAGNSAGRRSPVTATTTPKGAAPKVGLQSSERPAVTQMPMIEVKGAPTDRDDSSAATQPEPPEDGVSASVTPAATSEPTEPSVPDVSAQPISETPESRSTGLAANVADPITEAPHAVWYVRPPSGGQYGPASGDIMRTWITEGRVTLDSLVWREGWPEWKKAGPLFPGLLSANSVASEADIPRIVTEAHQGSSLELYRRRSSNMNTLSVVVMLLIACLVLFGALVYVVKYMN